MLTPPLCVEIGQLPLPRPTSFEWDEWNFQGYFLYAVRDELAHLRLLTHKANTGSRPRGLRMGRGALPPAERRPHASRLHRRRLGGFDRP